MNRIGALLELISTKQVLKAKINAPSVNQASTAQEPVTRKLATTALKGTFAQKVLKRRRRVTQSVTLVFIVRLEKRINFHVRPVNIVK
jgi:hypothetical protein